MKLVEIMDRTLGRPSEGKIGKFSLVEPDAGPQKSIEVKRYENDRLVAIGCWDEEAKVCYPGP